MLNIHPVPAFQDNYIWVIHNRDHAAVVDPGAASPVIDYLQKEKLQLCAILITHHHNDHTGGIAELTQLFNVPVYGPCNESITGVTHLLREGDSIQLKEIALDLLVIDIPGHTRGHIAYYGSTPFAMVFCGDTLFSCGCGRIFEGDVAQMYRSLQKLCQLPDETRIYCTHEYTLGNIRFARRVDPENRALIELEIAVRQLRHHDTPTLPTTVFVEKSVNPFLRCDQSALIGSAQQYAAMPLPDPLSVFSVLRAWKNNF